MRPLKFILSPFLFLLLFPASSVLADFAADAETTFACLEDQYASFLTPAGPATQIRGALTYRHYDDRNIYILIQSTGDVYFRKGLLKRQIGTMDTILADCAIITPPPPPPPPPPGGCITVTYPQAGLVYTARRSGGGIITVEDTTIVSATDDQTHSLISMDASLGNRLISHTELDVVENTHVTGSLRYLDGGVASATAETFFPVSTITNIQINTTYDPPRVLSPVGQICEGDTWTSPPSTLTSVTTVDNFTDTTTIDDAGFTATILVVTESVTTQAGTFDSVRIRQSNNDGTYHDLWISTDYAIPLLIETYDADDNLSERLETIAIN